MLWSALHGFRAARRRAYELDQFIGGTAGKLYFEGEDCVLPNYVEKNLGVQNVRDFADAPLEVQRLVDPSWVAARL